MKFFFSFVPVVLIAFCSCNKKFQVEKVRFETLNGSTAKGYIARYSSLIKNCASDPVRYKPDSLSLKFLELGQEVIQGLSKKKNLERVRFYTALDSSNKFLVLLQVRLKGNSYFYFDLAKPLSPLIDEKTKTAFCPPPDHCDAEIESSSSDR